ncbi:conserved protein [Tepidicaulis marinus]|uniref:Conserved protein n=1 Tax=Tepidicaulis marinus TaxID=1333998 RepID=A0A081BF23_9HYPH|nr:type II toxin-antitoxin system RelE/ParE family toxin [Tepidicaulis marinus]GAK46641.1 conserved protein [Tepidicaulis marinus]
MTWNVELHDDFEPEFDGLDEAIKDALLKRLALLKIKGPQLGRPTVDTLERSRHPNLKELRFNEGGGVWRFAFAFDPERQAIILCGGDKAGENQKAFYRWLIDLADARFDDHLEKQKGN